MPLASVGGAAAADGGLGSRDRVVLWPRGSRKPRAGRSRPRRGGPCQRLCILGPHHSCTNALAREVRRFFSVSLENDDTSQDALLWKHRVFTSFGLPALEAEEDVFFICMLKDPAFWIQSLSRDPQGGTFYDILPIRPGQDGEREDREGSQLAKAAETPKPAAAPRAPLAPRAPPLRLEQLSQSGDCRLCTYSGGVLAKLCRGCARGLGAVHRGQAADKPWEAEDDWDASSWEPEAVAWVSYPQQDLPNRGDVGDMDARDLEAVKSRAGRMGYAGFALSEGRAFFKAGCGELTGDDLEPCPEDSEPVVFYLRVCHRVGSFVRLSDDAQEVHEAFEAVGEAWDDRLEGMLGRLFRVLDVPAPAVVGLVSPDGGQGGLWYFPVGILEKVALEVGESVRLVDADGPIREFLASVGEPSGDDALGGWLRKSFRVVEVPESGDLVGVTSRDDRTHGLLRLPLGLLRKEAAVIDVDDVVVLRGGEQALRAALASVGSDFDDSARGLLGRRCRVLEVPGRGLVGLLRPEGAEAGPLVVPAAAVRKLREPVYGPSWRPPFCDRPRDVAQLFAPIFFDGEAPA